MPSTILGHKSLLKEVAHRWSAPRAPRAMTLDAAKNAIAGVLRLSPCLVGDRRGWWQDLDRRLDPLVTHPGQLRGLRSPITGSDFGSDDYPSPRPAAYASEGETLDSCELCGTQARLVPLTDRSGETGPIAVCRWCEEAALAGDENVWRRFWNLGSG